jgi:protein PhnA
MSEAKTVPACGFEWPLTEQADEAVADANGVIRDANGNQLADGDSVILIKDLKVKGSSIVLKKDTKVKSIRFPKGAGGHEVDCKTDQGGFMLKAFFSRKLERLKAVLSDSGVVTQYKK